MASPPNIMNVMFDTVFKHLTTSYVKSYERSELNGFYGVVVQEDLINCILRSNKINLRLKSNFIEKVAPSLNGKLTIYSPKFVFTTEFEDDDSKSQFAEEVDVSECEDSPVKSEEGLEKVFGDILQRIGTLCSIDVSNATFIICNGVVGGSDSFGVALQVEALRVEVIEPTSSFKLEIENASLHTIEGENWMEAVKLPAQTLISLLLQDRNIKIDLIVKRVLAFISPEQVFLILKLLDLMLPKEKEPVPVLADGDSLGTKRTRFCEYPSLDQSLDSSFYPREGGWLQPAAKRTIADSHDGSSIYMSDCWASEHEYAASFTSDIESEAYAQSQSCTEASISEVQPSKEVCISVMLKLDRLDIVLLEEDIIVESQDHTYELHKYESIKYFATLATSHQNEDGCRMFDPSFFREDIEKVCERNRLQLSLCSVETNIISNPNIEVEMLVTDLELVERISDSDSKPIYLEIIKHFDVSQCLSFNMKKTLCLSIEDVSLEVWNCVVKVDPTLINRLEAFTNCPRRFATVLVEPNANNAVSSTGKRFRFSGNKLAIHLNFPVPDLRPLTESEISFVRKQRNVREETLAIEFEEYDLSFRSNSKSEMSFKWRYGSIELLTKNGAAVEKIIELKGKSEFSVSIGECEQAKSPTEVKIIQGSSNEYACSGQEKGRIFHPTDVENAQRNMGTACQDAQCKVKAFLTLVVVEINSKHTCDLLYNRLAYDLVLWKPYGVMASDQPNVETIKQNETLGNKATFLYLDLTVKSATLDVKVSDSNLDSNNATKVLLTLENVVILSITAFAGNPNVSYLYIDASDIWLDQCFGETTKLESILKRVTELTQKHVQDASREVSRSVLTVAMIFGFDELRNILTTEWAADLKGVELFFAKKPFEEMWLSKLIQMLAVEDYPIDNYEIPEAICLSNFTVINSVIIPESKILETEAHMFVKSFTYSGNDSATSGRNVRQLLFENVSLFLRKKDKEDPKLGKKVFEGLFNSLTWETTQKSQDFTLISGENELNFNPDSLYAIYQWGEYIIDWTSLFHSNPGSNVTSSCPSDEGSTDTNDADLDYIVCRSVPESRTEPLHPPFLSREDQALQWHSAVLTVTQSFKGLCSFDEEGYEDGNLSILDKQQNVDDVNHVDLPFCTYTMKDLIFRCKLSGGNAFSHSPTKPVIELHLKQVEGVCEDYSGGCSDIIRRIKCSIQSIEIHDRFASSRFNHLMHPTPKQRRPFLEGIILTKSVSGKSHTEENFIDLTPSNFNVNLDCGTVAAVKDLYDEWQRLQNADLCSVEVIPNEQDTEKISKNLFYIKSFKLAPQVTIQISTQGSLENLISAAVIFVGVDKLFIKLDAIHIEDDHTLRGCLDFLVERWYRDIICNQKFNLATGSSHVKNMIEIPMGFVELFLEPLRAFIKNDSITVALGSGTNAFKNQTVGPMLSLTGITLQFLSFLIDFIRNFFSRNSIRCHRSECPPGNMVEGFRKGADEVYVGMRRMQRTVQSTTRHQPTMVQAVSCFVANAPDLLLTPVSAGLRGAGLAIEGTGNNMMVGCEQELKAKYKPQHM